MDHAERGKLGAEACYGVRLCKLCRTNRLYRRNKLGVCRECQRKHDASTIKRLLGKKEL